ncbi:aldo/keto reductase [Vicingaceae bacterium]|nr:aldo/keto reductase [Vicingaceae bacterium]MDC0004862.1 aldo/keto reductase [bacterium]MDC1452195.1 aldo/keto reductase [Vicingaceae bacterium]
MEYKNLGKSGLKVSRLSLGSWLTFGKQIGNNIASDLMDLAYDKGVNFFDNAEIYAKGESERVMGEILSKRDWRRDSYIVSSKAFFGEGGELPTQKGLSRKHLVEACEAALKRLKLDYLDLYYCHRPDKETPISETVWTMHNLIQQGKILYWGTSEWSAQEIMEAHMLAGRYNLIGPTMEQPQYNMLHRDKVEVEYDQIYKTVGLGTAIWSPLGSGILTGKYNDGMAEKTRLSIDGMEWLKDKSLVEENLEKVRKLTGLAKEIGTTMPKLAIAWCLKNDNVSTAILGASKLDQLEETLSAIDDVELLTTDVMKKISGILDNEPVRPDF